MDNNQVMRDKQLKMRVSDNFSLPYCPEAKVVLIIENKNSSAIDFTIDTNSPLNLKIEPATGCIKVGEEVRISVSRPKTLLVTQINEHLTFKVKYCCHKKSENSRNTQFPFSQNGNEQTYTIHNKITRGTHQSNKNPCGCTICNYSFNKEPFHHTSHNSKTLDSLISSKKKINKAQSDSKTQRKRRHSFTIYEPFVGETSNHKENIQKCLAARTQHRSPLKHTPGDNWNVSAIKKYIQDLKIKKALLKQDSNNSVNENSSSRCSSSERSLSIEQDMKITNQVENSEISSRHTNCDRYNDERNNDINFQEHQVYIHPMSNYYNQDFDENISVKSNDTMCFFREMPRRHLNTL
ncbi:uncharacterized protein TNIN_269041 [Trichonephila inaurata madagascariensis]|uniref:MSP domain-containing protein n=1 Tax=Trichonephila inaurata madagascariensis TaxID=2747483 RepID=A0A8X6WWU1_9ARAC|nr:uncharacterized protein TNIN_269041 [Trichonephila inaurata madagascariensis]